MCRVAVLAGGRGSRIGGDKPLVPLAGRALIEWPLGSAVAAGLRPLVVAKADVGLPADLAERGIDVLIEPEQPTHPLAGVVAALEAVDGSVVACACDLPFVPPELFVRLARAEGAAVVAPLWQGHLQPVLARYEQSALPTLRAALERDESTRSAIERAGLETLDERELELYGDPAWILFDVDSPEDLELAAEHVEGAV